MNAIPERQSATMLSQVGSLYDVRDRGVGQVLAAQPDLIPTLLDVVHIVPRFFGSDARLALESVIDPEEDAMAPELYAVIATGMPQSRHWSDSTPLTRDGGSTGRGDLAPGSRSRWIETAALPVSRPQNAQP